MPRDSTGCRPNGTAPGHPCGHTDPRGWKQSDDRTNGQSDKKAGRGTVASRLFYPFDDLNLPVGPTGKYCRIIGVDDLEIRVKLADSIVVSECIRFSVVLVSELPSTSSATRRFSQRQMSKRY
jgi:hypothetical protein